MGKLASDLAKGEPWGSTGATIDGATVKEGKVTLTFANGPAVELDADTPLVWDSSGTWRERTGNHDPDVVDNIPKNDPAA